MTATLEHTNDSIRLAVAARMAATPADDPKMQGYRLDQGDPEPETYAEWEPTAFAQRTVAHETLHQAIGAVLDRHRKYGPPAEHFARTAAMVNAAFGTTFTAADWALVMVLDKVARQRGPGATDDAAIDIAGYAACHQECRRA